MIFNFFEYQPRINIISDPVVQYYDPKVLCSICGDIGHSQISCVYSENRSRADMKYEDWLFWQYVDHSEQPESLW